MKTKLILLMSLSLLLFTIPTIQAQTILPEMLNNTNPAPFEVTVSSARAAQPNKAGFGAFNSSIETTDNTQWISEAGSLTGWVQIDTGANSLIHPEGVSLSCNGDTGGTELDRCPEDFTFEASVDLTSWDVLLTVVGETAWSNGEERAFTLDPNTNFYRHFRWNVTDNNGDVTYVAIGGSEIRGSSLYTPSTLIPEMTDYTVPEGYSISASSERPSGGDFSAYRLFNTSTSTNDAWLSNNGEVTAWVQVELTGRDQIVGNRTTLTCFGAGGGEEDRCPQDFDVLGSQDGVAWTTLTSEVDQVNWAQNESRMFEFNNTVNYAFYRWNVTQNNGDATFVGLQQIQLDGIAILNGAPTNPVITSPIGTGTSPVTIAYSSVDAEDVVIYRIFVDDVLLTTTNETSFVHTFPLGTFNISVDAFDGLGFSAGNGSIIYEEVRVKLPLEDANNLVGMVVLLLIIIGLFMALTGGNKK